MLPMTDVDFDITSFALRMRPFFISSLVILTVLVVGKFVINDYWGAVSLIFVIIMGVMVLTDERGLNATNALFYAVMALISGIFDVIQCVNYFNHSKYMFADKKAPTIVLVAQGIFIISPIALLLSAQIGYAIFADCRNSFEARAVDEQMRLNQRFNPGGPNNAEYYGGDPRDPAWLGRPSNTAPARPGPGSVSQGQSFSPFQGTGRRLNNGNSEQAAA